MAKRHTHPCVNADRGCTGTIECDGELIRNHDGFPEVVCELFHRTDGTTAPVPCDTCEQKTDDEIAAGVRCGTCLEPLNPGEACGDCVGGTEDPHDLAVPFAENH